MKNKLRKSQNINVRYIVLVCAGTGVKVSIFRSFLEKRRRLTVFINDQGIDIFSRVLLKFCCTSFFHYILRYVYTKLHWPMVTRASLLLCIKFLQVVTPNSFKFESKDLNDTVGLKRDYIGTVDH